MSYMIRSTPRCVGCGQPQGSPHASTCAYSRFTWRAAGAAFNFY